MLLQGACPPGSVIGILGGDDRARLLALSAATLGYKTHIYAPDIDSVAFDVAPYITCAAYDDNEQLRKFAKSSDVITLTTTDLPLEALYLLEHITPVFPKPSTIETIQTSSAQKQILRDAEINTAPYIVVSSQTELDHAVQTLGLPARLTADTTHQTNKAITLDTETLATSKSLFETLDCTQAILEQEVAIHSEFAVMIARTSNGDMRDYAPIELERDEDHHLHKSFLPAMIDEKTQQDMELISRQLAQAIDLTGLACIRFLLCEKGTLFVDDITPHSQPCANITLDACMVHQFEQTIRAICGLDLGDTKHHSEGIMLNLFDEDVQTWQDFLAAQHTKLYLYGYKERASGQAIGHVNYLKEKE